MPAAFQQVQPCGCHGCTCEGSVAELAAGKMRRKSFDIGLILLHLRRSEATRFRTY